MLKLGYNLVPWLANSDAKSKLPFWDGLPEYAKRFASRLAGRPATYPRKGVFVVNRKRRNFNRDKIFNTQGQSCARCGSNQDIHIHHIDQDRTNNQPSNAQVLCSDCHKKKHTELNNIYPIGKCVICRKTVNNGDSAADYILSNRNLFSDAQCIAAAWSTIDIAHKSCFIREVLSKKKHE